MTECVSHESVLLLSFNMFTTFFPQTVKAHADLIERVLSRVIIPGRIMIMTRSLINVEFLPQVIIQRGIVTRQ